LSAASAQRARGLGRGGSVGCHPTGGTHRRAGQQCRSWIFGAAEESSVAQAQELFDTNFFGLIRLTNEVLPHLRAERSGRIINISSVL
jgi:NAD(P)-dependent dehydrogenase (short-subunit alcohol dehydrogenase family)